MSTFTLAGSSYINITSAATTQVAQGQGFLDKVVINKALAGTVKVIDALSGSTANIATLTNGTTAPLGSVTFGVNFGSGLRIINSATEDITIVWRQ